jgi:hypothetical protein
VKRQRDNNIRPASSCDIVAADWTAGSGVPPNWAQRHDEIVDRHGPLLTAAIGRRLTGVWTPMPGLPARRSACAWGSRAPILFVFEGLQLEFSWHLESRSVTRVETNVAALTDGRGDREGWYGLGDDPEDPVELATLSGQRLWAVDLLEVDCDRFDLGFAFGRSYLAMTSICCCTLVLTCGPQQRRRIRLAQTGPTREGYPLRAVSAPRGRPAWPPGSAEPSSVRAGRPDDRMSTL